MERNGQYLFLPISAGLLKSLLQGIYLFIKVLIHVGFEHPVSVIAEPLSRCEHQIDHNTHPRQGRKGGIFACVRNECVWENTHTTSSACALLTSSSALGGFRWLASSRRVSTIRHVSRKQAAVAFKNKAPFARERACVRRGVTYSETYGISG